MNTVEWSIRDGKADARFTDESVWQGAVGAGVVVTILALPDTNDAIVLLDPDQRPPGIERWHPFHNIVRVTPTGDVCWRSELLPHETTMKSYYRVAWRERTLVALTSSYECELDADSGRLLNSRFIK